MRHQPAQLILQPASQPCRQVHHQQPDRAAAQQCAGESEALLHFRRSQHQQPAQVDTPLHGLHRIEGATEVEPGHDVTVSLRCVDAEESRTLNLRYREKNASTNVLSFRADLPESLRANLTSEPLGDIVICPVVIEAEAREQLKTMEDHWTHMLVHGFYHLIGYDHMTESESATMEALEIECLKKLGISNPYLLV